MGGNNDVCSTDTEQLVKNTFVEVVDGSDIEMVEQRVRGRAYSDSEEPWESRKKLLDEIDSTHRRLPNAAKNAHSARREDEDPNTSCGEVSQGEGPTRKKRAKRRPSGWTRQRHSRAAQKAALREAAAAAEAAANDGFYSPRSQ